MSKYFRFVESFAALNCCQLCVLWLRYFSTFKVIQNRKSIKSLRISMTTNQKVMYSKSTTVSKIQCIISTSNWRSVLKAFTKCLFWKRLIASLKTFIYHRLIDFIHVYARYRELQKKVVATSFKPKYLLKALFN